MPPGPTGMSCVPTDQLASVGENDGFRPMNPSPGSPHDIDLMEAIAAGDQAALQSLYDRHSALLFALCCRIVGDRNDAEEVLLEVFWELWEKADRYNPSRASPRTYIVQLARSRAIDRARSRAARERSKTRASLHGLDSCVDNSRNDLAPLDHLVQDERSQTIATALAALDDLQLEVLELAYFDGLSHSQISQRLQLPLGTVKTRIRQGLIKLRETLKSDVCENG